MLNLNMHSPFLLIILTTLTFMYGCSSEPAYLEWEAEAEQIVASIPEPQIPDRTINLVEYSGQQPDEEGSFDFREHIQRAIDELAEQGGGTLYFPHTLPKDAWVKQIETYRIRGPIRLRSNIELSFGPSIRLYFEFDPKSYMVDSHGKTGTLRRYEGTTIFSFSPLLYAFNEENIRLRFDGGIGAMPLIDGDGMRWQRWAVEQDGKRGEKGLEASYKAVREINHQDIPLKDRYFTDIEQDVFRPELIMFFMSKNIMIDGVHLFNSPFWMVHPVFSENMIFRNMMFDGQVVNNDAFDPESSRNILIENIQFNNHDDNLAVKAGRDVEGRNGVNIEGSILEGMDHFRINGNRLGGPTERVVLRNSTFKGHHAIAIGSEMSGGASYIYAYDNHSPIEVETALYLKSSRQRGGRIEHVYFFNNTFNSVNGIVGLLPNYDGDTTSPYVPEFRDVYVSNVTARYGKYGVRILGWADQPIERVMLNNVTVEEVSTSERELMMFNALNIQMQNVRLGNTVIKKRTFSVTDSSSTPPEFM
ncbi:MAG: glycosyl hydrolase family 28 protein [Bacteroidota bacterium]